MAEQRNVMEGEIKSSGIVEREYRKGNWTLHETLVLISAKKMDDERRMNNMKGSSSSAEKEQGKNINKPAEQRWKWVEDYCWRNGCMRSQNQCNDRWDNLMRDYKKVREYERKAVDGGGASYWKLERHERKDKTLPSNLLPQIYEALVEVVERKDTHQKVMINKGPHLVETPTSTGKLQSSSSFMASPVLQIHKSDSVLLRPPALLHAPVQPAQALPTLDSDVSEYSNSPTKRRRKGEASSSSNTALELGSAISRSASIIEKALLECEEKEEKRHKSLIDIEERKLKIEESKSESSLQAINGLTDAINQLANSIFALVSDRNQTDPK